MKTESGFITTGVFSAYIMEPHSSNSKMDASTKFLLSKADGLLRNETPLGVLKNGTFINNL